MQNSVFVPTREEFKEILSETVDTILQHRIPEIIRQANRKEIITPSELKDLTGMSFRMQKYHRDACNLPYSQDGRKIFYLTTDIEKFMAERRIESRER